MKKNKILLFTLLFSLLFNKYIFSENATHYLKFFSSLSSRMPGTAGHKTSADFIEKKFREAGLTDVTREQFFTVVPVDKKSYVQYKGKKINLFCVWPNLVRTSTLPPEGISGRLIYGGDGNLQNFTGKNLEGNIAVIDFNSGSNWVNLAMLGVKAFIFLESEEITREEAERKFLSVPLDVPRFYAKKAQAQEIVNLARNEKPVKLYGRMEWEKVADYNIYGYLEGVDEKLKKEVIIIESYYDSISVIPGVSPGAENACGISALLETLDFLKTNPPRRTVLFLACSSHYEALKGIDDFIQKHLRMIKPFKNSIDEKDRIKPKLFIGLDLSSGSDELGIWHNSNEFYYQRFFAPFGKKFLSYSEQVCKKFGMDTETSLVNGISPEKGIVWGTFHTGRIKTDGELIVRAGIPALSFVTVNDGRWKVDTPVDTFEHLNIPNIKKQTLLLKHILKIAIDDTELFPESELEIKDKMMSLTAKIVTFNPKKSFVPNDPVKNALVIPRTGAEKTCAGVRGEIIEMTDEEGNAYISRLSGGRIFLNAFSLDPANGKIILAPDMGVNGDQQYPTTVSMDYKDKKWMIVLFKCSPINIFGLIDPQYLNQLSKLDVFDTSNSIPDAFGYYIQYPGFIPWTWSSYSEPVGVVFAKPDTRIKIAGESGPLGIRLLLLNSKESIKNKELVEGLGFPVNEIESIYNTPYQASKDMIILDRFRSDNFENFGIRNERLKELQKESFSLLKKADAAKKKKNWLQFLKFSRQSQAIESRAYPDVKSTANDVVKGLIFYFMLLLPFAFFGERLIFGFPKLEKRIAGTAGIFIAVYWIMRLIHPAFKLTSAPEVILLSFVVLALSLIVLSIVASKFEEQMQRMKRESSKVYQIDVGRVSAAGAAFSLGVANMKRRKMRTILTSITLILLTFTVLSFTSIKSYMKFNQIAKPNKPTYEGILLRDRSWSPLQEVALEYTENEFSTYGITVPRAWYILKDLGNRTAVQIKRGNKLFLASAILGLSPEEKDITDIKRILVSGEWFENPRENSCIISEKIAQSLGIKKENTGKTSVRIYGKNFLVKGIFSGDKINTLKDLDDEPITPVDFSTMPEKEIKKMRMEKTAQVHTSQAKLQSFVHVEGENIVILPYKKVMGMKGTIHSIAVKFKENVNTKSLIENFVSKLAIILFAGIRGKTYVYSSMGLTSFSGIGNLIIPILIASLIVLNTMLGSVYERIKEIGTYSAVGLAPVHISALFLAESMVYAILGAVVGYLLGQVVAKFLMVTGMLKGLVLNYSSLSAVFSTIIIFITVLLSTLYPARKASQMAVPDVTRRWVLPEPKGDNWKFEFPFTVSELEVLGLVTFLTEYFNSYQDVSLGNFYTNGAKLTYEKLPVGKNKYIINTEIWLAPFDLGVSQKLKVIMYPLGEYNFYTINLFLTRTSGEFTDWKRLNRRFLDGIRKQFLVWRTVNTDIKKEYEVQGKETLKM